MIVSDGRRRRSRARCVTHFPRQDRRQAARFLGPVVAVHFKAQLLDLISQQRNVGAGHGAPDLAVLAVDKIIQHFEFADGLLDGCPGFVQGFAVVVEVVLGGRHGMDPLVHLNNNKAPAEGQGLLQKIMIVSDGRNRRSRSHRLRLLLSCLLLLLE